MSKRDVLKWRTSSIEYINGTYKADLQFKLRDVKNKKLETLEVIEEYYDFVVTSKQQTANDNIPKAKFKPFLNPDWKNGLGKIHKNMLALRNVWVTNGRPRGNQHPSYINYAQAKCKWRYMYNPVKSKVIVIN